MEVILIMVNIRKIEKMVMEFTDRKMVKFTKENM